MVERNDAFIGIEDLPFVPFDTGLPDEGVQLVGERPAGYGDGKPALLLDGFFLSFDDKVCEGVAKLVRGREGVQDGG